MELKNIDGINSLIECGEPLYKNRHDLKLVGKIKIANYVTI